MAEYTPHKIDITKIQKAVQANIPLSVTTYTLPHEMEEYMAEVLTAFLVETRQEHMKEYLVYCLGELVTNAKKANTKRIYFRESQLDITRQSDYERGMKKFKNDTLSNIKYYLGLQKQAGLYIKFIVQTTGDKLKLEVRNNSVLTVFEYKRIHDKIARAQQYSSVDDAFNQILDDSEGAGLGLIIMVLMLRKIGLTEENYQVLSENGETINRIILPLDTKVQDHLDDLFNEILPYIDALPKFPESITRINAMLSDPDSKLSDIALTISNDVSLTADLLKLVNSAAFSLEKPCHSINDAVKLVGIRGVRNLLFSVGTMQGLASSNTDQKQLWDHSYRVAFYSYTLAKNFFGRNHEVVDDSYICGLLHDMGKVIFSEAHPQVIENYEKNMKGKHIDELLMETITSGRNHSAIGGKIAEKWGFPEIITDTIKYHHTPNEAPKACEDIVSVVYMANMIAHFQEGLVEFYQFDTKQMEKFRIKNQGQLESVSNRLNSLFKKES
ncbi:MAG: HDOD domain-containing protein [Treponemataceae bacterium]|nr:HDOD domain-containing protein [Treponemataceae bacterium]